MNAFHRVQDWLAASIGISADDRRDTVDAMLRRTGDAVGYWLQLAIALAIATLGLALGSTAVVIGAMLISPLMQPIVELGIGLATGSPLLTLRAGARTVSSIAVCVLGAAAITQLLPFHDVTAELSARTSPTMLDLFVAGACALAAVYTTVRGSKDTVTAAAGTAIGISLVPPLCTAGYGLGVASSPMLRGALLLFTANFTAIVTVTGVTVLLLGYGQVDTNAIEKNALGDPHRGGLARAAARVARRTFSGHLGVLTRLVFPVLMLAAIYVPLQRALQTVSKEVATRRAVDDVLATLPRSVVRHSIDVRGDAVRLRVLMIGSDQDELQLRDELQQRLERLTGHDPYVEVTAVADASALDAVSADLSEFARQARAPEPPPPAAVTFATDLEGALTAIWPTAAGQRLRVRSEVGADAARSLTLQIVHLGVPLGAPGVELMERGLSERLGVPVVVQESAISPLPLVADVNDFDAWLRRVEEVAQQTASVPGIRVCVELGEVAPVGSQKRRRVAAAAAAERAAAIRAVTDRFPHVESLPGPVWQARAVLAATCAAISAD